MTGDSYNERYEETRNNLASFSDKGLLAQKAYAKKQALSDDNKDARFWAWYDAVIDACADRGLLPLEPGQPDVMP